MNDFEIVNLIKVEIERRKRESEAFLAELPTLSNKDGKFFEHKHEARANYLLCDALLSFINNIVNNELKAEG